MKRKKKNKGFTLLEIISVIVIIGIIIVIGSISVVNYIENSKAKTYESFAEDLRVATNNYMIDCITNNENGCIIPKKDNDIKITYKELVDKGYSEKLKDPEGPGYCDRSYVIAKNSSEYGVELEYKVCLYCDKNQIEEGCSLDSIDDKIKPTCELEIDGAYYNGWYQPGVIVRIKNTSAEGIEADVIGIGDTSTPIYDGSNEYTINNDGTYTVFGYIKDKAGNENTCSVDVKVDGTAPTGTIYMGYEIYPKENSTRNGGRITINDLTKYGTVEGVIIDFDSNITVNKESYIYADGINIKKSGAVLSGRKQAILKINEGTYDSLIIDLNDNENATKISKVQILKKESIASVWTNRDVSIYVEATDPIPGAGLGSYSYDGGNSFVSNNINVYPSGNFETIYIKDLAGNVSSGHEFNINTIDKSVPTCSVTVEETGKTHCVETSSNYPYRCKKSETWYNTDVNLSLTYKEGTGVESGIVDYGLNNTSQLTSDKITTDSEDTKGTTISGYVTDKAGNKGTCSKNIKRDTVKPYKNTINAEMFKNMEWYFQQLDKDGIEVTTAINHIDKATCEKNNCTFNVCLSQINGFLNLYPQKTSELSNFFTDNLSGYHSYNSAKTMYDKNGNLTSTGGCLLTAGENPCKYEFVYNPYDKAGNFGEPFTVIVNVGYIGIDTALGC